MSVLLKYRWLKVLTPLAILSSALTACNSSTVPSVTANQTEAEPGTLPSPGTQPSPAPSPTVTSSPAPNPSPTVSSSPRPSPSPTVSSSPSPAPSATVTPSPTPTSSPGTGGPVTYQANPKYLSGVWANDGGKKIAREETLLASGKAVSNSIWKGNQVNLFAAKNEVVAFNLVLESGAAGSGRKSTGVRVAFDRLTGPGGSVISSTPTDKSGVYNWTQRDIELFYVRYLKIKGLSRLGYELYDERHVPKDLQRPNTNGKATGGWKDRPKHDMSYPDIAVPMEAVKTFDIEPGQSQSVWVDVYVPKTAASGVYYGALKVFEGDQESYTIPVQLKVRNFTLPDVPTSKTMLALGYSDIAKRYVGASYPANSTDLEKVRQVRDRHFQIAHRHKISVIDNNDGTDGGDRPAPEWVPRINGSLFTEAKGYRGPGTGVGNGVFSIGTYSSWGWKNEGAAGMASHSAAWNDWFKQNSPGTERFLYLIDESSDYGQIQTWATQLNANPASNRLAGFATLPLPAAMDNTPALSVVTSTMDVGDTNRWNRALSQLRSDPTKRFYMYNGKRPASGSFMTDDDGVALRETPWGQYKKGIDRWFYWESTYYTDFQGGRGNLNVFQEAQTFGGNATYNDVNGMSAGNYGNGDGLLFYPGTDRIFPNESYGLDGPIASLRLKHWRRGIQDVDYLALASAKDPARTQAIVNRMVPKVLWENGVSDPNDPTWVMTDISWSINPDDWEAARAELASIIDGQ